VSTAELRSAQILLDRFRTENSLTECKVFLSTASTVAQRLERMSLEIRSEQAPEFNVFTITRRGHYEVTTHSRLLGEMLDPKGSHEQGNLFLAPFLDLLVSKKPGWTFPSADHRWTISRETDSIDIMLSHPDFQKPQTRIIIENKWSAPDREQQLLGYWKQQRERTGLNSIPAVYLTPNGRRPRECSAIGDPEFLRDLVTLSYAKDIRRLIGDQLREIKAARVKETISQYLMLMESIDEN
jgi:PD-(D/E)XK nuclease superfamily